MKTKYAPKSVLHNSFAFKLLKGRQGLPKGVFLMAEGSKRLSLESSFFLIKSYESRIKVVSSSGEKIQNYRKIINEAEQKLMEEIDIETEKRLINYVIQSKAKIKFLESNLKVF